MPEHTAWEICKKQEVSVCPHWVTCSPTGLLPQTCKRVLMLLNESVVEHQPYRSMDCVCRWLPRAGLLRRQT